MARPPPSDAWGEEEPSEDSFAVGPVPIRRAIKVAWQGGTKVDEENFLKMQEDYLRVMTQFNDGEKQRRQLIAKLARAEEAAKKLLAERQVSGGNASGGKGNAAVTARRTFELEAELSQVSDENTQLRHKLARERKANEILRERNKALDMQVRKALADYQRLLRQTKNPKNARANSRPLTSTSRPTKTARTMRDDEEEMDMRYVDQQDELAALKEENTYLREKLESEYPEGDENSVLGLQQQIAELRRQLADAQARIMLEMPDATRTFGATLTSSPTKGQRDMEALWELHEIDFEGQVYLLDPKTQVVFSYPSQSSHWPHPVGRMVRADPLSIEFRHQRQIRQDFFTQLDKYLKGDRTRIKDVFAKFDKDKSGKLERAELKALLQELVPGLSENDMKYLAALMDADGDGAISFEELMDAVSDVVHAGQAVKDAYSSESMQVLERVRDLMHSRAIEVEDAFMDADKDRDGELDFVEVGRMLKQLVPSLSDHELRFLLATIYKWDVNGNGKLSLAELRHALQLGSWTNASGPLSPSKTARRHTADMRGSQGNAFSMLRTSITGQQFQSDINRLHAENMELKQHIAILTQQLAEMDSMRRDLEDAKLQIATAEDRWLRSDPANFRRSLGEDVSVELKEAWSKVKELRQRWLDAKAALESLRTDYTTVVNKLDEIHKQLNEERKARFRMEKDKEFWRIESTKYRELAPELEKTRLKVAELEKENRQAFANVFSAPEGATEEMRHLKTELLELRKAKADSETREADARKQLAEIRAAYASARPGEVPELRAENHRLERELNKAKVDLDAVMARLTIYDRTAVDGNTSEGLTTPREPSDTGGDPRVRPNADVYRELQELRNVWHEDKCELDKIRKLLEHEEERSLALQAQVEELRSYYEGSIKDRERKLADTGRLGHRQVERLEERIRKLEAQLRNAYAQGWKRGGVRSSVAGGSVAIDLEDELADLDPDENIFELHLASAVLDEDALGKNPPTFLSLDFFEHETQATSIVSSSVPEYDYTIQYVLRADTFFIEYLDTRMLVIELNRSKGWDFETVGTSRIPLQQCLDDFRLGVGVGRNRQYHYADICGPGGRYLGRLRWAAGILKPIDKELRDYRMATAAKRASAPLDQVRDEHPAARAIALAAEDPNSASHLRIIIKGCRGLKPNVAPADCLPYVGYTFPGMDAPHFSTHGRGVSPVFDDEMIIQLVRTRELESFMSRFELEFEVYDDGDRSTNDSSIIGVAAVSLKELIEGLPVEGYVPLYSAQGRQRRGDIDILIHWHNPLVVAQPPGAGDQEERRLRRQQVAAAGNTVRVSTDRGGNRSTFYLGDKDQSLSKLAGRNATHPDDPDELRSIDGRSEKSDTRLAGEELGLYPSQSSTTRTRKEATTRKAQETQAASQDHRSMEVPRRSLSTRISTDKGATIRQSRLGQEARLAEQRYNQGDDSLADATEMLPLVRDVSHRLPDNWDDMAANHIIISVESVRLGAEVFHDPRIQSVFVMYEFLPDYISPEDQVTSTHPKTAMRMDFNFSTAVRCGKTPELHRQARYAIGEMMRNENEDAWIPFCLVSDKEAEDEEYHEFGFAEVNLHSIYTQGDLYHHELDVLGQNSNEIVATLTISIIAQRAIRNILSDTAP